MKEIEEPDLRIAVTHPNGTPELKFNFMDVSPEKFETDREELYHLFAPIKSWILTDLKAQLLKEEWYRHVVLLDEILRERVIYNVHESDLEGRPFDECNSFYDEDAD